jgi:hypothetical protein
MVVRATGILVKDGSILLLDQDVMSQRRWSLPGGKDDIFNHWFLG